MRKIKRFFPGEMSSDGAGVKLRRCVSSRDIPDFDPFLMMDFFDSQDPSDYIKGFPFHPHRGIETITYLISGRIVHEDSMGNKGEISNGQCQWMSAGSGILHQEMPKESDLMLGSQIWLNLPKENKMGDPEYRDIDKDNIGHFENESMEVKIIAGSYAGVDGPISKPITDPSFFDVRLKANSEFIYEPKEGYNVFGFLLRGKASFNEQTKSSPMGFLYENESKKISIKSLDEEARFFILAGKPLNEPVAWGGPIVMNTKEELDLAFRELQEGNFIKFK